MEKVMDQEQRTLYENIQATKEQLSQVELEYWNLYSSFTTLEFWVIFLLFFVAPLVVLYFVIDRRRIFLLGFYGFNIHVWFGYIDTAGDRMGFWGYPFEMIPFLSGNISLEAALVPILFMLVYQWTLNHKKNFYVYSLLLSVLLSFIVKPLLTMHLFFELHNGTTYVHLFILYVIIFLFSKLITNVFIKMHRNAKLESELVEE
ncbi:hypothetical protein M3689_14865 [Alkalihalophilus marmarensis]|uniref:Uncharacterized protein n=1 Tax=Alkalihalophilus marmarensis DSM 21297 TaxID=1188261 RepID=U6SRC9_9BACI|nr:CBO0543 family protein [Alkalihalophilus marmarensis]ERN53902.1 hypothetical protein A33I_09530 [Alkalihalophilus marmarensis DSM 21297]MCM3490595.1 hypothetical protein [Alkalihalophilus marmarensis]